MRLALFEPDIPQNTGTLIRLGACLGVPVDVIEPCGFPWGDRGVRRAGLDYIGLAEVTRHASWEAFLAARQFGGGCFGGEKGGRLVLLTTKSAEPYWRFSFRPGDTLLLGRESVGAPSHVHERADARLTVPMRPDARSLNVAIAAAMVLGEGLRQTGAFPAATKAASISGGGA
ncbi:MAG: tRNA (cytidine(34)-2'-O)-methyltransferase [Parvibaculum sp.]